MEKRSSNRCIGRTVEKLEKGISRAEEGEAIVAQIKSSKMQQNVTEYRI